MCFDLLFCVFYFSFDPVSFDLTGLSDMFLDNVSANDPATAISHWDEEGYDVMLCMFCYVTLCYVMLCYIYYVMLCYICCYICDAA